MRILQHLKNHVGALLLIFILLIGQAVCDLALPTFTSVIVDVGIQQRGIEHASPNVMRPQTFEATSASLDAADRQIFEASYELGDDGYYHLVADADWETLDALAVSAFMIDDETPEGVATQRAIVAAQEELEACGVDIGAIQMGYLFTTGGLMLLVTLGMVACSVLVGLIASRAGAEIARSLRERLFTKVVSFGATELNRFSTASLITRSTNDITQVQMVLIMLMRMVLYAPILAIGGIVMISTTNVSMSWIIVLAIALLVGLVATLFGITYPKFRIMQKLIDRVKAVVGVRAEHPAIGLLARPPVVALLVELVGVYLALVHLAHISQHVRRNRLVVDPQRTLLHVEAAELVEAVFPRAVLLLRHLLHKRRRRIGGILARLAHTGVELVAGDAHHASEHIGVQTFRHSRNDHKVVHRLVVDQQLAVAVVNQAAGRELCNGAQRLAIGLTAILAVEHLHKGQPYDEDDSHREEDDTDNRAALLILVSHCYSTDFAQNEQSPKAHKEHYNIIINALNGLSP